MTTCNAEIIFEVIPESGSVVLDHFELQQLPGLRQLFDHVLPGQHTRT